MVGVFRPGKMSRDVDRSDSSAASSTPTTTTSIVTGRRRASCTRFKPGPHHTACAARRAGLPLGAMVLLGFRSDDLAGGKTNPLVAPRTRRKLFFVQVDHGLATGLDISHQRDHTVVRILGEDLVASRGQQDLR